MIRTRMTVAIVLATIVLVGVSAYLIVSLLVAPSSITKVDPPLPASLPAPRSTEFFEANVGEARKVATWCEDGTVRGDERANAATALTTVEARERFERFRGKR